MYSRDGGAARGERYPVEEPGQSNPLEPFDGVRSVKRNDDDRCQPSILTRLADNPRIRRAPLTLNDGTDASHRNGSAAWRDTRTMNTAQED